MSIRHRPARAGFTLIELSTVGGLTALLIIACGLLLKRAGTTQRDVMQSGTSLRVADILSDRLRRDIAEAMSAATDEAGSMTLTIRPDRRVVYAMVENSIERRVLDNEAQVGRDRWQLGKDANATWEVSEAGPERKFALVKLTIEVPLTPGLRPLRVVSRVGSARLQLPTAAEPEARP